ncbi:MAG: oligosaccharide flippase family protein [Bacteroidales bacterium]
MVNLRSKFQQHSVNPLKGNIVANYAGSIWQALMGLIFIPLYIKFLGIEAWGLIGFFATIQIIFGLLDMGLSGTLNREMARLSVLPNKEQEMRDLVRTLELIYWSIAVFVVVCVITLSPFIAHHWFKVGKLPVETVEQALLIMGFVIGFQMPIGFYSGGLLGLQKQVLLSVINICISSLRGAGAVIILWLVSSTIQAYFFWQIIISLVNVILLAYFLKRILPVSENKAVFQKQLLKGIWRFAAGMSGITILSVVLTQLDKIILSRLLSLEMFGYYMLASTVAMSLGRLVSPVFVSIYPRFTQLVSLDNQKELKELYHKTCQLIAVLVLPAAIVIALFSYEIILLWTQNPATAEKTFLILSIMICGTALNGIMNPPYALQLAFAWTKLPFYNNLIAVFLFVPLIIYLTSHYGAVGAAIAWLVLNMGMFFFYIPIMHSRLLCKEKWNWYWQDVILPIVAALSMAGLGRIFFIRTSSQVMMFLNILIILILTIIITLISVPSLRSILYDHLSRIRSKF